MAGEVQEHDKEAIYLQESTGDPVGYLEVTAFWRIAADKKPNKFRLAMYKSLLGWTWRDK
jgi:hypothetical protein